MQYIKKLFNTEKCVSHLHTLIQILITEFSSYQLTAPQNMSPTVTRNLIHYPLKTFNLLEKTFQNNKTKTFDSNNCKSSI